MGKEIQSLQNLKMLLSVPLFTCWEQHLLFGKIQAVTHLIPQRLNLREKLVPFHRGSFCLERHRMPWRSSGVTKKWKICCSPKVERRWLEKKRNLAAWVIYVVLEHHGFWGKLESDDWFLMPGQHYYKFTICALTCVKQQIFLFPGDRLTDHVHNMTET